MAAEHVCKSALFIFFRPAFLRLGTYLMTLMKTEKEIECLTGAYSCSMKEYTTQSSDPRYCSAAQQIMPNTSFHLLFLQNCF